MRLADNVWEVICETMLKYKGMELTDNDRDIIEAKARIFNFDGGAFVADGNEFDLFVTPDKRGKWKIRKLIKNFMDELLQEYGKIIVNISELNNPSLRLAKHFGFVEVSKSNGVIRLEYEP